MGAYDGLDISKSGLDAYRAWMESAASNVANANTTRTVAGGPYRRKTVTFQEVLQATDPVTPLTGTGVAVSPGVPDTTPFPMVFDPSHPDANPKGYVSLPNVEPVREMVDLTTASRAYEANVSAFTTTKTMLMKALEIGR